MIDLHLLNFHTSRNPAPYALLYYPDSSVFTFFLCSYNTFLSPFYHVSYLSSYFSFLLYQLHFSFVYMHLFLFSLYSFTFLLCSFSISYSLSLFIFSSFSPNHLSNFSLLTSRAFNSPSTPDVSYFLLYFIYLYFI